MTKLSDNYNSFFVDDVIETVVPTKSGYRYVGEKQTYYSKFDLPVELNTPVSVHVREQKDTGATYFLSAKVK